MKTRTWPYGTRKSVEVLGVESFRGSRVLICAEVAGDREGHVIVGELGDEARAGDMGEIVFCQGGPAGGYWRYKAR